MTEHEAKIPALRSASSSEQLEIIKQEDVSSHSTGESLWVIIDGKVFDLTEYAKKHPGGQKVLLQAAGTDATREYHKYHKPNTLARVGDALCIGKVENVEAGHGKRVWGKVRATLFRSVARS